MEKKTIGGFIAALRKANGMTQKDLAEQLNVSDKTISRWERDDGAPDLAVIPVIAEIFGVTCDELLRGERRSPTERIETTEEVEPTPKAEKQRQRLLTVSLSKYKTRTFVAMGVSVVGLIAAMVSNFGFLRAYIGFFVSTVFFVVSVVCQAVFINSAFLSVSDDTLPGNETARFKWSVVLFAEWSIGLTTVLLGFSLPLVCLINDAYQGIAAGSWFLYGVLFAAAALLIVATVCYFLNGSLLGKGICSLQEKEKHRYYHNHALKRRHTVRLVVALVITMALHAFGGEMLWSAHNLAEGTSFHDYESFVAYTEQDVPYDSMSNEYWSGPFTSAQEQAVAPEHSTAEEIPIDEITYYDEHGNEISETEALTRTLEDKNGNVVCTYVARNETAASVRYTPKDGTVLPITVISQQELRLAWHQHNLINAAYCVLYPIEVFAALLIYFKKRVK